MKYEYDLTRQDYIEFNIFHICNSKSNMKTLKLIRYATPLLFLIMPFIFKVIAPSQTAFLISLVVFVAIAILWFISFPKQYKKTLSKSVSKMLGEGKNTGFLGMRTLTVSDEGIVQVSEAGETKNNWNVVGRLAFTADYIYIYIASMMAYIVPTRVFADVQEKDAFLDIVRRNMASNN